MHDRASFLRRLVRLGPGNARLLGEALLSLAAASLAIRLLPFRRTAELMAGSAGRASPLDPAARDRIANRCRWAVAYLADRVPWRAVCFQRGLALHWMLRRRGIPSTLHYGVAQGGGGGEGLRAHVWVSAGERVLMGGEEAPKFACLATFPARD